VNRVKSFAKNNKVWVGALALVAIYTVITVFTSNDVGLGGLLVTLFLLRYAHKQYEKNSKPTVSSLIGHLIAATIALVIIASPLVQKPLEGFNWATKELGEVDVPNLLAGGCPDSVTISPDNMPNLSLRTGCTQRVIHAEGMDPRFMALDARFTGPINNYVDIRYVAHNMMELTPKNTFPAGVSEVPVATMTAAQAASIIASGTYTPSAAEVEAIRAAAGQ
jgi:hypothetical protein